MMQTVTREQALAGTLALVNPAHPLQARPAPEALVPAMPDACLLYTSDAADE